MSARGNQFSLTRVAPVPVTHRKANPYQFSLLLILVMLGASTSSAAGPDSKAEMPVEVVRFISAKEAQALALTTNLHIQVSGDIWRFFRTAKSGNISATTNAYERLLKHNGYYAGSTDDDPGVG